MKPAKNDPPEPTTPYSAEQIRQDCLATMTPAERMRHDLAERQLAAQVESNAIAKAQLRIGESGESRVAEEVRRLDEERAARVATLHVARARLEVSYIAEKMRGQPLVTVRVTAQGHVGPDGEFHFGQLTAWDLGPWEQALKDEVLEVAAPAIEEAERLGQPLEAAKMRAELLGRGRADGFQHRRYVEFLQFVINRLICQKPLAALVSAGICRVVGEVEIGEPVRNGAELR